MKTKILRNSFLVIVMTLISSVLFAQGPYLSFNAGYALGLSTMSYGDNQSSSGNTTSHELVKISFGKGLNAGATFGYMFTSMLGAELGLSYLLGGTTEQKTSSVNGSSSSSTSDKMSAKMFRINPSLVVRIDAKTMVPYLKFGCILGAGSVIEQYSTNSSSYNSEREQKYNGGMALGLTGALGVKIPLCNKMDFFAEMNMVNMSYSPSKSAYTKYTINGADHLASMKTIDKETEYVSSYTEDSSVTPDSSQPTKALKIKFPYGSFGINAGILISLK